MSRKTTKSPKRKLNETIDFSQIGGLNNHLKTLREIIILPLLHSNVFDFFDIRAPRGVLFYGPPGMYFLYRHIFVKVTFSLFFLPKYFKEISFNFSQINLK